MEQQHGSVQQGVALARMPAQPQSIAIAPYHADTFEQAIVLAETLAKSGLLGQVKTKEQAFLVMAYGAQLGLPPVVALQNCNVIEGKVVMAADLMVAICLSHQELCEYFEPVQNNNEVAIYRTKRKGRPELVKRYTDADAKQAQLLSKATWQRYTAAMLAHRCAAALARLAFPDLMSGVYCHEEQHEIVVNAGELADGGLVSVDLGAPRTPVRAEREPTPDWDAQLEGAATVTELDAVAVKIRTAGVDGQVRKALVARYASRRRELTAPIVEPAVAATSPQHEAQPVAEAREPGAEG